MNKKSLKNLITELISIDDLSLEKYNELEFIYNVDGYFIDELLSDINTFKFKVKTKISANDFLSYIENQLFTSLTDYAIYLSQLNLIKDLDDELLGEIGIAIDKTNEKIKVYENMLGIRQNKNKKSL